MISRIVRIAIVAGLLWMALSATPSNLLDTAVPIAALCLFCVVLLQLRPTPGPIDQPVALVALWALATVMAGPFVPALHLLGDTLRGAR